MDAESSEQKPKRLSRRTITILSAVATVVVLAAVIFGLSALSDPADPSGSSVQLSAADQSARLYDQGIEALESGDETAAASLFQKAVAVDPANSRARDELTKIVEARTPATSNGSGNGNETDDDDSSGDDEPVVDPDEGFTDPVADLGTLLPSEVDGYELGLVTVVDTDANVPGDPVAGGPTTVVTRALFSVHDFETIDKAKAFVNSVSRTAFPENAAEVTVDGVPAYFGTDGVRFSTVSYSRGRYAFEVIVTTDSGAPGALLDISVDAASAFPDSL